MRVQILTHMVGRDVDRRPGDIVEVSDAEAVRLIAAGYAVAELEPEQATVTADSTAVTVPPKRRRRSRRKKA